MPKVSVITPVYNAAEYIGEAIQSVAQSDFTDYEHIIVNDGSTDLSLEAIKEAVGLLSHEAASRVKIFSKTNSGEADTDNYALARSAGEFIVVLNADDIVGPNLFRRSVEELEKNPAVVVSYPDWTMIDGHGQVIRQIKTEDFKIETLVGEFECLPGPGAFVRRRAIEDNLLRDPRYPLVSDYECWLRLCLEGPFIRIPEFLGFWRLHGENLSLTSRGSRWGNQAILVASDFCLTKTVFKSRKLKRLAALGLSRAYLLAALQGSWDSSVPIWTHLRKSFFLGTKNGRPLIIKDIPILAQIAYGYLVRFRSRKRGKVGA